MSTDLISATSNVSSTYMLATVRSGPHIPSSFSGFIMLSVASFSVAAMLDVYNRVCGAGARVLDEKRRGQCLEVAAGQLLLMSGREARSSAGRQIIFVQICGAHHPRDTFSNFEIWLDVTSRIDNDMADPLVSSRIFVKALPPTFTEAEFKKHFARGGSVTDAK